MADHLLTPSKITAWLDCPHFLTLRHEVEAGVRDHPPVAFGEMARMLMQKGEDHEQQVLARYRKQGRDVLEVPGRNEGESFARWVNRVGDVFATGPDVVFQMPFIHEGIRGIADFLERRVGPSGVVTYEPVDAKLARNAAKPGHVLQLCFYAEAIGAATGQVPDQVHLELGSGGRETIRFTDVAPYWRRLRRQLEALLAAGPEAATTPEPCSHCGFCEFEAVCDQHWRDQDSLVHVAGVRQGERILLGEQGVDTIATLATREEPVDELDPNRLDRLVRQASLQVKAREGPDDAPPPFEVLPIEAPDLDQDAADAEEADEPANEVAPQLTGFAALPAPDDGDVFLDFEGHPFWHPDEGLFILFGLIEREDGDWRFKAFWAHDRAEEAQATEDLVAYLVERRRRHPNMHVYHYNHTERSALVSLTEHHGVAELALEQLVGTGVFVDLYRVVTGAVQVGVESYGLKHIERLTEFQRSHDIDRGSGAVVEYEHWMSDRDQDRLDRIARYNEDDVRATLAVRDWLVEHRPDGLAWREPVLDPTPPDEELDARIVALHEIGPGTPEHLMGDLLGYWRRERRVVAAESLRHSMADEHDQLESPSVIGRLQFEGFEPRHSAKTGNRLTWDAAEFTFPPQPLDADIGPGSKVIVALDEQHWAFYKLDGIDAETGRLGIIWDQRAIDQEHIPTSLAQWVWFDEAAKQEALCVLADELLAGEATRSAHAILRRDPVTFASGHGPSDGQLVGTYEELREWVPHLDDSYLPVQGPPGTGKTFTGAHLIHALVKAGQRVGVTAMSHHAIDNLTKATVKRFKEEGDELRVVRKAKAGTVDGVPYINDNTKCATGDYDVIAGTPWLFASTSMIENPLDVLVVDEAGQLGLADTLAASISATNVVLLGDPQQLPQVAQAVHPNCSGVSALEHLLGEGRATFPPERGLLLQRTWRMHPDICGFISGVMYDSELRFEDGCALQATELGTGLRWARATHEGRSNDSPEEAEIVTDLVSDLIGRSWVNREGKPGTLASSDVIVVTPYRAQRRRILAALATNPDTAEVEVGTVDKFQGREAAVVVFSMATSSAEFMPRNADFLFSKNRLNVAISRARCLAYVVCTDAILDTRARDVDEMVLISALCDFVEHAEPVALAGT